MIHAALPATNRRAARHGQRGYGIAIILVVVTLATLAGLLTQLDAFSTARAINRDATVSEQIQTARDALLRYAANHPHQQPPPPFVGGTWQPDRPGGLPCPDKDDDGLPDDCAVVANRIGRLPWIVLGLPNPALLKQTPLWYAVADGFYTQGTSGFTTGTYAINSNSVGNLRLLQRGTTVVQSSGLAALIIAPGEPLPGQVRTGPVVALNYLEGNNALVTQPATPPFLANPNLAGAQRFVDFDAGEPNTAFNDRVLAITSNEIFDVVEAVIERRLALEVVPEIRLHNDPADSRKFLSYPIPVQFPGSPPPFSFVNTAPPPNINIGLLPVIGAAPTSLINWSMPLGEIFNCIGVNCATPGTACTVTDCSIVCTISGGGVSLDCNVLNKTALPLFVRISANVDRADLSFLQPKRFSTGGDFVGWPMSTPLWHFPGVFDVREAQIKHDRTQVGSGQARIAMEFVALTGPATIVMNIVPPKPSSTLRADLASSLPAFGATAPPTAGLDTTDWFIRNRWYELVYYAVAPPTLPFGVGGACAIGTNCLQVRYPGQATADHKAEEVLILMGRPSCANGTCQDRTIGGLNQFLEGTNQTSTSLFLHRAGRLDGNDRIVSRDRP